MFLANNRLGIEFLDTSDGDAQELLLHSVAITEVIACVFGKLNLKKWMVFCLVTIPSPLPPNPTLPPRLRTEKHIYFQ